MEVMKVARHKRSGTGAGKADESVLISMFKTVPDDVDLFYTKLLDLKVRDSVDLIRKLGSGLPYKSWVYFSNLTGFSEQEMLKLTQMSRSTLNRRKGKELEPPESERLARVARVFCKVLRMFRGDLERARVWFNTPRPTLGDSTPFDMTASELGALEVEGVIGRIQYGVYS